MSRAVRSVGGYELQGLLGRGGMGEVYRAFDREHDRTVALKLLPEALTARPEFVERFRRESHATARLRDPHVIPIHRYGEIDGRLFIDMRLVDGVDLAGMLSRQGRIDPARAVAIVGQVAQALDAAHAEGLVHRDVKPSNILLAAQDFVYLIDFGIAHVMDATSAGASLTATGTAVGTTDYMAPERFAGMEVDERADVYSLACVLYECLIGQRPLPAARPELPPGFGDVIAVGMAKEPADRYPSAGELATAACEALAGPAAPATRTTTKPTSARRRLPIMLGAAVLLAVATVLLLVRSPDHAARFPASFAGTWAGLIHQSSGKEREVNAVIVIAADRDTATVRYLELQCSGTLRVVEVSAGDMLRARETIDAGPCSSESDVWLQLLPGGAAVDYRFKDPKAEGTGTLRRS